MARRPLHHPHGRRAGAATYQRHGARGERFSHQAVQPQEALCPRGRVSRPRRRRAVGRPRMTRWAVVLAGGIGSRFWPLSTPSRPKQLLPLVSEDPMLSEAVHRLEPVVEPERILILTNHNL